MVEYQRHDPATTNSAQEMKATLSFLAWVPPGAHAVIRLDSEFIVRGCNEWRAGWKAKNWRKGDGKPVANTDLWKRIDALLSTRKVQVEWVKGHSGDSCNDRANALADEAARDWGLIEGRLRIIPPC
jgi:ribonuclease HI